MKCCKFVVLASGCVAMALAASALDEPIYTITTSGTGTNDITAATIEVTENGETTTKSFSEISFTTGTIRKRGSGFLHSAASLVSFTGTILVEEGAWLATANGCLGYSVHPYANSANVVISNGASVVYAIPSGSAQFRQAITFGGTGYNGMGAICIENKVSNLTQFFWNTRWTMTDDATIAVHNTNSSITGGYLTLDMAGHTLTFQGYGSGTGSTFTFQYPTVSNPGHIILDGTRWAFNIDSVGRSGRVVRDLTGTSANTIELKKGTRSATEAWFHMVNMDPTSPWKVISRDGGNTMRATHGQWGSTNLAAWAGPVELVDGLLAVSGSRGSSFTYYNTISGAGGLSCSRGQQVCLANGGNTFTGEVRINTNRAEGEGELRLFADGALPANGSGAKLYDSSLDLAGYCGTYHLPSLMFDVGDGLTETFRGGTNGVVKSLRKIGVGTLDISAPVTVTGVTEIAAGTLRVPYAHAGLIAGAMASIEPNYPSDQLKLIDTLVLTNRVALGADLAYTDEEGYWLRDQVTWGGRALFTYHGYLWNRSGETQNWTFALNISQGANVYLNGSAIANLYATDYRYNGFIKFRTIPVPPGANRLDLRIYSTTAYGPSYNWSEYRRGYTYAKNSKDGEKLAWKPNFGLAIDMQGRETTNAVDYVAAIDPGDGSLLTVSEDGMDDGVAAVLPKFDHLKFTGGTLDVRGSDIMVPVLEGVNGAVTNSNTYFPGGSLTIGQKWIIPGAATANKTLKVTGKLKFAAGSVLEGSDLALLSRTTEHTLATATGGIEGMPAFDNNAPGNKGWHLVMKTVNGVGTLKLFWRLGTAVVIR